MEFTPMTKAALMAAAGSTGVVSVGGYVVTDERRANLSGRMKYRTFEDFINEASIIAAGVRLFLNLIAKATWQVTPARLPDGDPRQAQADEIAASVESMMYDHKTPWSRIIRRIAMYRFYGFALLEWQMKRRPDGQIGMLNCWPRPQRTISRWDIVDGEVVGVWQLDANQKEVYLPREQLIYAVDDSLTEDPEGMGLLRHCARHVERLKAYEAIENIGYENDLRGMPVAYMPTATLNEEDPTGKKTAAAKAEMNKFLKGHIRNRATGMLLDSSTYRSTDDAASPSAVRKWALELMRGDSNAFEPMAKAISRINQEIARVLGVEHLMVGADGVGSLALAKSKVGTFYITVISTQEELVEVVEDDWMMPLANANGWPDDLLPELQVEEVRDEDITQITEALSNMATAGAVLSPEDEAVREVYGMLGLTPPDPSLHEAQMSLMAGNQTPPGQSAVDQMVPPAADQPVAKSRWVKRKGPRGQGGC